MLVIFQGKGNKKMKLTDLAEERVEHDDKNETDAPVKLIIIVATLFTD